MTVSQNAPISSTDFFREYVQLAYSVYRANERALSRAGNCLHGDDRGSDGGCAV